MLIGRPLLTMGALAYLAVAVPNGLDRLSKDSPELARLVPGPFRAEASRSASYSALVSGDAAGAVGNALAAIRADPISPDSTAALGSAYSLAGDAAGADRAFRVAALFGWRNQETQAYLYSVAMNVGDYAVAADRADAIMRAHPRMAERPAVFDALVDAPSGRAALAGKLAQNPPWTASYFNVPADSDRAALDRRVAVLAALPRGNNRVDCAAVAPLTARLIEAGRRDDGMTVWNSSCPGSKAANPISDSTFLGLFGDTANPSPFGWRRMGSGDVAVEQSGAKAKLGIRLTNKSPTTSLALVQPVAFPAGRYSFKIDGKLLSGAGPVNITFGCGRQPVFPNRIEGSALAQGQTIEVTPCDRQQIGLWIGSQSSLDLRAIAFENVR